MAWYRYRWAHLPKISMERMYPEPKNRPNFIALEGEELEEHNCRAFNLILYFDSALTDEKNDLFFEDLDEAIKEANEQYDVKNSDWNLNVPPVEREF